MFKISKFNSWPTDIGNYFRQFFFIINFFKFMSFPISLGIYCILLLIKLSSLTFKQSHKLSGSFLITFLSIFSIVN